MDYYMIDTFNMLKLFEKDCMDVYCREEKKKSEESMESRIDLLQKKYVIRGPCSHESCLILT